MLERINELVTSIVVVIVLATFLELLLPEGQLQKYVRLVIGLLIVLIMLNPVISILESENFYINPDIFAQQSIETSKEKIMDRGEKMQKQSLENVDSRYKAVVYQEVDEISSLIFDNVQVMDLDIDYNKDINSPDYGEIYEMYVLLGFDEMKDTDKTQTTSQDQDLVTPVKEIKIDLDQNDQKELADEKQKAKEAKESNDEVNFNHFTKGEISSDNMNAFVRELSRSFRLQASEIKVEVINSSN